MLRTTQPPPQPIHGIPTDMAVQQQQPQQQQQDDARPARLDVPGVLMQTYFNDKVNDIIVVCLNWLLKTKHTHFL